MNEKENGLVSNEWKGNWLVSNEWKGKWIDKQWMKKAMNW